MRIVQTAICYVLCGLSALAWVAWAVTPAAAYRAGEPTSAAVSQPGPNGSFQDPFAYCAAVGTIDAPDARYTGPQVPDAVARGLHKAFGLPETAPLAPFLRGTHWRCMSGKVYACNVGANLPCLEKADLSRTPAQGVTTYCQQHPGADVIPAYVTGRATVYLWRCTRDRPTVVRQVTQPDARGFLANVWHLIEPSPGT